MLWRELAEINLHSVTASLRKTDLPYLPVIDNNPAGALINQTEPAPTIQWWSVRSENTVRFVSEVPKPASKLALNPHSVAAHERHGTFFIGQEPSQRDTSCRTPNALEENNA